MAQYQKMEPTVDPKYMDAAAYLMNSSQTDKFLGRNVKNSDHAVQMPAVKSNEPKLFGFAVQRWSPSVQFFFCVGGIFFFYLIYGYMQELIFRLDGFRTFGWYLTLIQFACYTVFGLLESWFRKDTRKIPLSTYGLLAFLTVATMGLSNSSVGYLNYPTQVVFKCCKLIPVMIGGILIQEQKINFSRQAIPISSTNGLTSKGLKDLNKKKIPYPPQVDCHAVRVLMISLALCADAVIGNVQEKAIKAHQASNTEVVLYSYGIGFWYILTGLILSGQLMPAFLFCQDYPKETYGYAIIFSLTGYIGISFVLQLIRLFGALVTVTVTTGRKAVSIFVSFLSFEKPFTPQYAWSGMIVLLGIYLNLYSKNRTKMNEQFAECARRIVIRLQGRPRYSSIPSEV
ncbi:putative adenosine 3'-phospho 5'-phosphosulfate transporter 2-like [Apostichopus japonicus]|uniref:Adenosine 3'-phospho 5'-phosphosulfate transporter 2 n=1 Tax=Stichopus japonicus TaxID=307972 RepID=A0A2G8JN37_STIJA|nr:putative adenosine 3'-phospho 5'-phosphosulfate transporter 2-like [Apostichopus japonicus]